MTIPLEDLGRVSRWVVRRLAAQVHADDILGEIGLAWAERASRGEALSPLDAYHAGVHYLRRVVGDRRYAGRAAYQHVGLEAWDGWRPPPPEEWGILGWRLARAWPTLTPAQQAGLWSVLDDGYGAPGEAAQAFGVGVSAIAGARATALRRLDDPGAYTRVAYRARDAESRRAQARERQRRYRERRAEVSS